MTEHFRLDQFISNFKGGARQYLFYFRPSFPSIKSIPQSRSIYLVRSATLPEGTLENIEAGWQGWTYKAASRKTFADWTVSFNVDKDADILKSYNRWHNYIRRTEDSVGTLPEEYMVDQVIQLLNHEGNVIDEYSLKYAYPLTISPVQLDYLGNDVAQFDVTFQYQYYTEKDVHSNHTSAS